MIFVPFDAGDKEITLVTKDGVRIRVEYDDVVHANAVAVARQLMLLPYLMESTEVPALIEQLAMIEQLRQRELKNED